ncbi:MAG: hypothetical protein AB3A66_17835 [Nodularia sp. CChRGM 3473]
MSEQRKAISLSNLLLIVATFFVVVLLWQLRSLLVTLMIAVVLAAAIAPIVNAAEKLRIPYWSQVKVVRQLSRGFEKVVERKIQEYLAACQGRVQQ